MANSYFKFKHFTIEQNMAAMKVGTDGVLLGAWVNCNNARVILDVGTGTGLIALMCAQKNQYANIDALEIDNMAFVQAGINIENSPWNHRIVAINDCLQHFSVVASKKYDLIVSNPPFFNNSLKNVCEQKSMARHTETLTYMELIKGVVSLLSDKGRFAVVLPFDAFGDFEKYANENLLYLQKVLKVKPTPQKQAKRVLMEYGFEKISDVDEKVMVVEEFGRHGYSDEYKELTKDFYLKF
ncbi:tRNA1(Val) (adenine(37)-N6)-methyltransferase [Plebeiibacterium marinum]|uniref:tRNA1(Val) (adenine(37)-N6)-methyltransferase n=1 Tax=Plebeiibacterium marinum TaxID=2992111 RepID=A0AAE3MCG2_9BACT|nr:methyltransferase [Plebeiobacterium marinum]MCW3804974.1 methyltransferase [Plebeiobacterium marinum]